MAIEIETTYGKIAGTQADAHQRFLGVPFARPPVGARRFLAPEGPEPWSETRPATEFGLSAPQNPSPLPGMEPGPQGEDCLFLNVYTPAADSAARPVMVWIHGGGFTGGSGSQALYEGGPLCTRGDVVLVSVNYRLGALGYLTVPGADPNLGQLDQIAALRWVRDNIERFGGDPGNVTIFGESAGGMAVATLLGMPGAAGLFHRAIPQSGAAHHVHSAESAARVAERFCGELGLPGADAEKLRQLPVERILEAQAKALVALQREPGLAFAPVVDPNSLPQHPLEAVRAGASGEIPLLVGTNRDESKLFNVGLAGGEVSAEQLEKRVRALLRARRAEDRAPALIDAYRRAREGHASTEAAELLDAIDSDHTFRIPAIRLAEAHAAHPAGTYGYLFTWESPARRGALGSCHALELPFVFGSFNAPTMDRFAGTGPEAERLSQRIMDAWIAFARSGDPAHPGLPEWPTYDAQTRATMLFDRSCERCDAPLDAERAAWDGIL